jgi:hypothetical protein
LTNPFDIHMTFKHILELSGVESEYPPVTENLSCKNCQSVFKALPSDRGCKESSIEDHWCTCNKPFIEVENDDEVVKNATQFAIEKLNDNLIKNARKKSDNSTLCEKLTLKSILSALKSEEDDLNNVNYLLTFVVSPSEGIFETTVKLKQNEYFETSGAVSRLNSFGDQNWCVKNDALRLICYCKSDKHNESRDSSFK